MQNYRKLAKDDRYIKNQYISLRKVRSSMLLKISFVVVPLGLILIFLAGIIICTPSPDKWQHKDITFSDITRKYTYRTHKPFLNTANDGSFILPLSTDEVEILKQQLKPNQQYHIIYTENPFLQCAVSLSVDDCELIKLENSVANWEYGRTVLYAIIASIFVLIPIGSYLNCRKERWQIKGIKSKINNRLNRREK